MLICRYMMLFSLVNRYKICQVSVPFFRLRLRLYNLQTPARSSQLVQEESIFLLEM